MSHVSINADLLSRILKTSRYIKQIIFDSSKIDIDGDLDFGDDLQYFIKHLSFRNTGNEFGLFGKCKTKKDDLVKIFKAIKDSGLSKSLETVNMDNLDLNLDEIRDLLKLDENGLGHIQIINYDPKVQKED